MVDEASNVSKAAREANKSAPKLMNVSKKELNESNVLGDITIEANKA